jgi:hypothetical protein
MITQPKLSGKPGQAPSWSNAKRFGKTHLQSASLDRLLTAQIATSLLMVARPSWISVS